MLREVLDATERLGPTVIFTQYGKPFSEKSLTGRMLAEGGASTRQLMEASATTTSSMRSFIRVAPSVPDSPGRQCPRFTGSASN